MHFGAFNITTQPNNFWLLFAVFIQLLRNRLHLRHHPRSQVQARVPSYTVTKISQC